MYGTKIKKLSIF